MTARAMLIPVTVLMAACVGPASADEALARRSGCFECHDAERKTGGPNFPEIAARYRNDARARDALVDTMKKGSKGKWPAAAGVPMPPYAQRLSDAERQRLVDWVLGL